ncbi:MAG: dockerin type I domain-containing protein [Phycisphaerae bacterium]
MRNGTDIGEGNVRRWNGTEWLALGPPTASVVREVLVHQGELIAGGHFVGASGEEIRGIAKWNGTHWSPIGNSNDVPMTVNCLAIYNGQLHASGTFNFGDGATRYVARLDGETWHPIAAGLNPNAMIESIIAFGGDLFVGGRFGRVNGQWSPGIARWSPSDHEWRAMRVSGDDTDRYRFLHLGVVDGEMLAAGDAIGMSGDRYGPIVARWTCQPPRPCPGDLNGNSDVDIADLALLSSHFGEQAATGTQVADIDGDDAVTLADLALLLRDFGAACE